MKAFRDAERAADPEGVRARDRENMRKVRAERGHTEEYRRMRVKHQTAYVERNREKHRAYQQAYAEKTREQRREYQRAWYARKKAEREAAAAQAPESGK